MVAEVVAVPVQQDAAGSSDAAPVAGQASTGAAYAWLEEVVVLMTAGILAAAAHLAADSVLVTAAIIVASCHVVAKLLASC